MAIAVFFAIVVVVIAMGVTGIIVAIETNRTGVAKVAAVIHSVASVGRQGKGLGAQWQKRIQLGGGSCVAIKEGRSEGNPVGGNDLSGNKFHPAEKSCRRSRGMGRSVLLWYWR
uniref:Uncharacterized protein n=1 Tax=Romanomermis culicivorax TaxID=13658 RepID=A0A915ILI4_ROMCU